MRGVVAHHFGFSSRRPGFESRREHFDYFHSNGVLFSLFFTQTGGVQTTNCFDPPILEKFVQLEQTQNEKSQKLEQLRLMDNNIEIDVGLAKTKPIGVDTDEDYIEIKKIMEYKN